MNTPVEIYLLTPDRWDDLATLFGKSGAMAGCWCMYWRMAPADFNQGSGQQHKEAFQALVAAGHMTGLLAYMDGQPAGWCSVAPRELSTARPLAHPQTHRRAAGLVHRVLFRRTQVSATGDCSRAAGRGRALRRRTRRAGSRGIPDRYRGTDPGPVRLHGHAGSVPGRRFSRGAAHRAEGQCPPTLHRAL